MRALLFLALVCVGCVAPDAGEVVDSSASELRSEEGPRRVPCPMRVESLAPRAVPAPYGGLILATGCGFRSVRRVLVEADAFRPVGAVPVAFVVVDDEHLFFHSGERASGGGQSMVMVEGRDLSLRYFGWMP